MSLLGDLGAAISKIIKYQPFLALK